MDEARRAPLDVLLHVRAGFVYQLAHVFEYRARKRRRPGDVGIHARIAPAHRSALPAWRCGRGAEVVGESTELQRLDPVDHRRELRSEEHTSELQSLMRISYAVFCLKKKQQTSDTTHTTQTAATAIIKQQQTKSQNTITNHIDK